MNKEKYYKFDKRLYGTLNFNLPRCGKTYYEINKYIEQLQQENKILKENAENNDKVVDKINWENQLLKKENKQLKEVINKAIKCVNKYEDIKAYYEYIDEDEYEEYNYNEDFKKELIHILQGDNNQ